MCIKSQPILYQYINQYSKDQSITYFAYIGHSKLIHQLSIDNWHIVNMNTKN
jgi:hypothetical protein